MPSAGSAPLELQHASESESKGSEQRLEALFKSLGDDGLSEVLAQDSRARLEERSELAAGDLAKGRHESQASGQIFKIRLEAQLRAPLGSLVSNLSEWLLLYLENAQSQYFAWRKISFCASPLDAQTTSRILALSCF